MSLSRDETKIIDLRDNPEWQKLEWERKHRHCSVLEPEDIPLIRALLDEQVPVPEIAKKFEVSRGTIYSIIRKESWSWIK